MALETMRPDPDWTPASVADAVDTFRHVDGLTVRVWGGDWCKDCRAVLPSFAAGLAAAGVDAITEYPVEKRDGEKVGPAMDEYAVEYIPTIVVERKGAEVARFVESAPVEPIVHLAEQLDVADPTQS